ncbi:MAG TPA: DUF2254 domain-containing protein [Deltaproteobacteria bacterium]|nr:DUF2254 domain-containing protein [Deltaproteobacteria bacterium]
MYSLRGGFLVRPFLIAAFLGFSGAVLSAKEESTPALSAWIPAALFPSRQDPQVAQVILGGIAASTMTVVSIVFAILLMTLTLASTQFSPRILISFVRDRTTQWTLGIFLGTFSYCMAALPAARSLPHPFLPAATVTGAMLLAVVCVGWLIFFINHISQAISVNHIVDRIARETEWVMDEFVPHPREYSQLEMTDMEPAGTEASILSRVSGYIRFVDVDRLLGLARMHHVRVRVERRVGHYVPEGIPLMSVARGERVTEDLALELLAAFDIGPTRTLQQDVEFGVIQIVDIALRAISPAVNDPSTAISCVDQLSRVLIRWVNRAPPRSHLYSPPHVLRVVLPWITLDELLDTAFEQIRHYSASDVAVSLRLLRAFGDIARTAADAALQAALLARARRVVGGCTGRLAEDELAKLRQRLFALESAIGAEA